MGTLLGKEAAAEQADPTPAAVPAHPGTFPGARQRLSRGPPERRQQMGWRRSKAAAQSPFCCFASWKESGSGTLLPLARSCTWRKTLRNVHGAQGARGGRRQRRSLGGRALSAGGKPAAWPLLLGSPASHRGLSPPGGSLGRSGGARREACADDLSRLRDRALQCDSWARGFSLQLTPPRCRGFPVGDSGRGVCPGVRAARSCGDAARLCSCPGAVGSLLRLSTGWGHTGDSSEGLDTAERCVGSWGLQV